MAMPKIVRRLLGIMMLLALIACLMWWLFTKDFYETGKDGSFTVDVGDTFTIELYENGSTGYSNCWLDMPQGLELAREEYQPSLKARMGYVGAGGTTVYTFRAIEAGEYTLAAASCPTGVERKSCSDFTRKDTKPSNIFQVTVTE